MLSVVSTSAMPAVNRAGKTSVDQSERPCAAQNLWRRAANGLTSGSLRDRPQEQSNGRCADAGTEPGLGPREHDRRGRGAERPLLAGGRAGGGRAAPMAAEARRVRGRAARPPGPPAAARREGRQAGEPGRRRLRGGPGRLPAGAGAARGGFRLAGWRIGRGIEVCVIQPSSVPVDRRARRAKTDALDVEMLLRTTLAWLREGPRGGSRGPIPGGVGGG